MIDPTKHYSLGEIVRDGLVPGVKNLRQAKDMVLTDAVTNRYLNASRVPYGDKGVQYKVLGENIIKYLVQKEI